MKKTFSLGLVGLVLFLSIHLAPVHAGQAAALRPTISVSSAIMPLDRKAKLVIMGSGYRSGQEVLILFHDALGVLTALPEVAVANERGSWATVWNVGEYFSIKLVAEGVYAIMAADAKYNIFATTTAGFVDVRKDTKDWPDWAKAADIKKPEEQKKKEK